MRIAAGRGPGGDDEVLQLCGAAADDADGDGSLAARERTRDSLGDEQRTGVRLWGTALELSVISTILRPPAITTSPLRDTAGPAA